MFGPIFGSGCGLASSSLAAAILLCAVTVGASPTALGSTGLEDRAAAAATNFGFSCTDIAYFGYCRVEANCTTDGSSASKAKTLQHTFLDLGQCIGYDDRSKTLKWRSKSVAHWQSTYCAPCSQCTIDPKTTVMTCRCQYTDTKNNHKTHLTLSDHVSNDAGVMGCLNVAGDPDHHD